MTQKKISVGAVGLGEMARAMAANLARAGALRCCWNRTGAVAEAFAQDVGAAVAPSLAALAAECDLILISVADDAAVLAVVDELMPSLRAGSVVVDTSTVAPATARAAAARAAERGAYYFDAPVSGGVEGARAGSLVMMAGGDAAAFATVQAALAPIATRIERVGDSGSGQTAKAVNQLMVAGINQAVSEGLAFAEALGLDVTQLIDLLSAGAADSWQLRRRGPRMASGDFAPGFKMNLHAKDLRICQQLAAEMKAQLPLAEMTLIHYRRLIAEGYGEQEIAALIVQKRRLFSEAKS